MSQQGSLGLAGWLTELQSRESSAQSFDPVTSINSGQTFLWEKADTAWYGINGQHVLKISIRNHRTEFSSFPESSWERDFFRLEDDMESVRSALARDPLVASLLDKYWGLRLLRQDPEQCLFSFLCASNTSIAMIRLMLHRLARRFGKKVQFDGKEFFTFPSAQALSKATISELASCRVGYRAKAIKTVAEKLVTSELDLRQLKCVTYKEAKEQLLQVDGIGNKIADCILLFSLDKIDSFPIDVWIARSLADHYVWLYDFRIGDKLTPRQYDTISAKIREHFGKYSGYAQQYLYYDIRQRAGRPW